MHVSCWLTKGCLQAVDVLAVQSLSPCISHPSGLLGLRVFRSVFALICAKASIKCLSTGADAHCLCEEKEERKVDVFNLYVEQNYSWQASG